MTQPILRRAGSWMVLVLMALFLVSATTTTSSARNRRGHAGASRRSAHSARHAKGKHHAKLSRHSVAQRTLSTTEKEQIIAQIKALAKTSMVSDDSVITAEEHSTDIQSQLAQAAKEEAAEDDVDVSIEQFFKERPGAIDGELSPDVARERQQDYTLYDESDPDIAAQRSDIMAQIIDWIGTRYEFGGVNRSGVDCSAFTRAVFQKAFGFELPRTAVMQAQLGDPVSKSNLEFGDLVFFRTAGYAPITHVGIYIGEGLFANAACSKGVSIASLSSTYWSKHYVGARRLFSNSAMAAGTMPSTGTMADESE